MMMTLEMGKTAYFIIIVADVLGNVSGKLDLSS